MKPLFYKAMRLGISLLAATVTLLALMLALRVNTATTASLSSPVILAEYQVWHGLVPTHTNPPYTSTDPLVIARHITAAKAMSISGFVVDWYGPSLTNGDERGFMDQATAELVRQSAGQSFQVALMYDEGAVRTAEALTTAYTTRMISDLLYARQYLTAPAYLNINGHPALFVFPYPDVDPHIDWAEVRAHLGLTVTLIDEDPNPGDPQHDAHFDGFYAWVQPGHYPWSPDGLDWGEDYLKWFYNVMAGLAPTYTNKVAVGGVWPGFDDSSAPWGQNRYIWPRCGQTWRDTWGLAHQYNPPFVLIATWNDFEEGTGIEFGTGECLVPPRTASALPGRQIIYTHTIVNTGKFTDTLKVTAHSGHEWQSGVSTNSVTLSGHASATLSVTLMIPPLTFGGTRDQLNVTATSQLSPGVYGSLVNTTTVLFSVYLPVVTREETGVNLLADGGFETPPPWPIQDGMGEIQVAPGWQAWYLDKPPSYVVPSLNCSGNSNPACYWMRPEFRDISAANYPQKVHGGSYAQKYFSFGRMHEAGLYQQVGNVTPDSALSFSVYMWAWMCYDFAQCDGGLRSDAPSEMHLRVGIDPTGGTDPFGSNVVWSAEATAWDT